MRTQVILALAIACLCSLSVRTQPITIRVNPRSVYIEWSRWAQHLNFDFAISNSGSGRISISSVEVSVLDKGGNLVQRKFVDVNGTAPSIMTIPKREIEPGSSILVFNPFHTFPLDIPLARLVYKFEFVEGSNAVSKSTVVVEPATYRLRSDLILPLKGRVIVYDGHDFYAHHRRFDYLLDPIKAFGFSTNLMRYSYDFCPVGKSGEMITTDEEKNESWLGYGKPVYAPSGGLIVASVDNFPDNRSFNVDGLKENLMLIYGNYIVIDHQNGEFSLLAHLRQGSSRVRTGDRVVQGQQIAAIGASGSANFPHLHYELRNSKDASAEGLPSYFRGFFRVLGSTIHRDRAGQIDSGDIIEAK